MPPIALWIIGNGLLLLIAYLLGSIPTGYLLGKWLKGIDIRTQGSGSTGATNVLRTLGKGPGATVLLIDVLKGAAAIALTQFAYQAGSPLLNWAIPSIHPPEWFPWMVVGSGMAVLLGHSKSVWLNFAGGKSVATGLGVLLTIYWPVGLITLGVFAVMLAVSRIVSLSSIVGAIAPPLAMLYFKQPLAYVLFVSVGGLYVIVRHRANIQRLLAGTEPRLGQSAALPEHDLG